MIIFKHSQNNAFISDIQYYVPVKLCRTASSIHLFKIAGRLTIDKVRLNKHYVMGHSGDKLEQN